MTAWLAPLAQGQEGHPGVPPPPGDEKKADEESLFIDPVDGAFDVSKFLESRAGFFPVLMPITEPAVGYGLAGGLLFFHDRPGVVERGGEARMVPPTATFVGGFGTENGSWGAGAGHLHKWDDGRIRYLVGGAYASMNLDWFGQGSTSSGNSIAYNLDVAALIQKLTFQVGDSDFFLGPTQRLLVTDSTFDDAPTDIDRSELHATASGLGLSLGFDTRNSLFSPTLGTKTSLDWTQSDDAIGSDFDYGRVGLETCNYIPCGGPFTLGLRADAQFAGEDAPYFDLGSIRLRGIKAYRYVDNVATTFEAELRWDVSRRWTLVGFGGVGFVADEFDELDDALGRGAGGAGFRYLIAKKYDLRVGLDFAVGPEEGAVYVTVGTGWLRD